MQRPTPSLASRSHNGSGITSGGITSPIPLCDMRTKERAIMFPDHEDPPTDLIADDNSTTLRAAAELFEKRAADSADAEKRETLLEYAKLYRRIAELPGPNEAEADDR